MNHFCCTDLTIYYEPLHLQLAISQCVAKNKDFVKPELFLYPVTAFSILRLRLNESLVPELLTFEFLITDSISLLLHAHALLATSATVLVIALCLQQQWRSCARAVSFHRL